ncbi:MAG: hypothetical protein FWG57_00665 [Endomicrobia bacterium]|nr:hypothetical protein [Endomicrobiia bacterium]
MFVPVYRIKNLENKLFALKNFKGKKFEFKVPSVEDGNKIYDYGNTDDHSNKYHHQGMAKVGWVGNKPHDFIISGNGKNGQGYLLITAKDKIAQYVDITVKVGVKKHAHPGGIQIAEDLLVAPFSDFGIERISLADAKINIKDYISISSSCGSVPSAAITRVANHYLFAISARMSGGSYNGNRNVDIFLYGQPCLNNTGLKLIGIIKNVIEHQNINLFVSDKNEVYLVGFANKEKITGFDVSVSFDDNLYIYKLPVNVSKTGISLAKTTMERLLKITFRDVSRASSLFGGGAGDPRFANAACLDFIPRKIHEDGSVDGDFTIYCAAMQTHGGGLIKMWGFNYSGKAPAEQSEKVAITHVVHNTSASSNAGCKEFSFQRYIKKGAKAEKVNYDTHTACRAYTENFCFSIDQWFTDKELTKKFNFNNPVNKNITLFSEWTKDYDKQDYFMQTKPKAYYLANRQQKDKSRQIHTPDCKFFPKNRSESTEMGMRWRGGATLLGYYPTEKAALISAKEYHYSLADGCCFCCRSIDTDRSWSKK